MSRVAHIERAIRSYTHHLVRIEKTINKLAVIRLCVFLLLVGAGSLSFGGPIRLYAAMTALLALSAFLYLMVRHDRCYRFKTKCGILLGLQCDDLARAQFRLQDIAADPPDFAPHHPFAHDLDLSTPFSLLKMLDIGFHNRTRALLRRWMDEIDSVAEIERRQQALADLSKRRRFRLKLALAARSASYKELESNDLSAWLATPPSAVLGLVPYLVGRVSSLFLLVVWIAAFVFQYEIVPWWWPLIPQILLFFIIDRRTRAFAAQFMLRGKALTATYAIIEPFESLRVDSPLLKEIQARLGVAGSLAGPRLRELLRLHDALEYRSSALAHWMLNTLFLWDQHYLRKLAKWRDGNGAFLPAWVDAVFEIEALSSVANFRWLFADYPFPELREGDEIHIEAEALGHPTLPAATRVGNDFALTHEGHLHLITGSNMSGKSTFLRTLGVNLVLARMGAPVCARRLRCSLPKLWTSIRIQDSQAEGVSYFYAEVRRLKLILDEIAGGERPVFYLLDEILKGTNSRERLIACKALVRFLIGHKASGLITTHDLELLALAEENPERIRTFHFQEGVRGDEMFFDYRLRPGVLTSTNALRVMKFAKVPLEFEQD